MTTDHKSKPNPNRSLKYAAANSFQTKRPGRGVAEWADAHYNICTGCEHDCLYCYAKAMGHRFKGPRLPSGGWLRQQLNPQVTRFGQEVRPVGVVMFPTTHDLTPKFLPESLRTIKNLLVNNRVLVVTKPHLCVVRALCGELTDARDRILFRFTIGSLKPELCAFWEPGAPAPAERLQALQHAFERGFATSVSVEPMLDSVAGTCELVDHVTPFVTETIWIGKMQRVPQKINAQVPGFAAARQLIRAQQTDAEILRLVALLKSNAKVRAKDSIKAVCGKYR